MACCANSCGTLPLLTELKDCDSKCGSCVDPCCHPCCNFPFAQVTMTVPPPILAPTRPQPVKPLCIPCPESPPTEMSPSEREHFRIDNFYNNYNIDWRERDSCGGELLTCDNYTPKRSGVTVDGKSPCCDRPKLQDDCCPLPGCPTGFKPCAMKLTPPPCCHPLLP
ncbi:uncharacterized protein BDFB_007642, partial [Asbolus verrucosus]